MAELLLPDYNKKLSGEENTFKANIKVLRDIVYVQAPKIEREGKMDAETQKWLDVAKQLLQIATRIESLRGELPYAKAGIEGNKPDRVKEFFAGVGAETVATMAFLGMPFLLVYEGITGTDSGIRLKDLEELHKEGIKHQKGVLVGMYTQGLNAIKEVEGAFQNFFRAYNEFYLAVINSEGEKLPEIFKVPDLKTAKENLTKAIEELNSAMKNMNSISRKYQAEMEKVGGFVGSTTEFYTSAAKELAITIAMLGAIKFVTKGAEIAYHSYKAKKATDAVTAAGKAGGELGTVAEVAAVGARTVAVVEGAEITAERIVRGARAIHTGEKVVHQGVRAEHAYKSYMEIDHTAQSGANGVTMTESR